jgi:hypothetical protein
MTTRRSLSLLLAAAALLASCASVPPLPHGISLIDAERLAPRIQVHDPLVGRSDTGTLRVAVPVSNRSGGRITIEGRATYLGIGSNEAPSGWKRVFINKDSTETLEFLSLSDRAGDYRIELREGNR